MNIPKKVFELIPKGSIIDKILNFLKAIPFIGNFLYNSIGLYIAVIGAYLHWALSGIPGIISLVLLIYLLFKIFSVVFSVVTLLALFLLPLIFIHLGVGLLHSIALTFLIIGIYVIYRLGFDLSFLIPLAIFIILLFFGGFFSI